MTLLHGFGHDGAKEDGKNRAEGQDESGHGNVGEDFVLDYYAKLERMVILGRMK